MKLYFKLLSFGKPMWKYITGYSIAVLLAVFFSIVSFPLLIPLLNVLFSEETKTVIELPEFALTTSYITDAFHYYLGGIIAEKGKFEALKFVCIVIFGTVLMGNLFKYISQRILASYRVKLVQNIRNEFFENLLHLNLKFHNKQRKGNIISAMTNDVNEIENSMVSSLQGIFREPLMIIGMFIMLFNISVELTLYSIIIIPISATIITLLSKKLRKQARYIQGLAGSIISKTEEALGGIKIIKSFDREEEKMDDFGKENHLYSKTAKSIINKRELASPISEVLGISVAIILILIGGKYVIVEKSINASEFITYLVLYSQILTPGKNIAKSFSSIQRGLASGERILSFIDNTTKIDLKTSTRVVTDFNDNITFKSVSFKYEEKQILKEINLCVEKGKTIALVGPSGGGKSTLVDLIPRFYDVQEGEILIDNINVKNIDQSSLRNLIGVVSQESILFNDTIKNNIWLGNPDASEEEILDAAKIANAHEFIVTTEKGYETEIGDRGVKLSGGQRQRLSIARAVLKNPPILILDEATSALDTESEKLVQDALEKLMANRTSIVIAHRLSTIKNADKIIVIKSGKVVEEGTHDSLKEQKGVYYNLKKLQS